MERLGLIVGLSPVGDLDEFMEALDVEGEF